MIKILSSLCFGKILLLIDNEMEIALQYDMKLKYFHFKPYLNLKKIKFHDFPGFTKTNFSYRHVKNSVLYTRKGIFHCHTSNAVNVTVGQVIIVENWREIIMNL